MATNTNSYNVDLLSTRNDPYPGWLQYMGSIERDVGEKYKESASQAERELLSYLNNYELRINQLAAEYTQKITNIENNSESRIAELQKAIDTEKNNLETRLVELNNLLLLNPERRGEINSQIRQAQQQAREKEDALETQIRQARQQAKTLKNKADAEYKNNQTRIGIEKKNYEDQYRRKLDALSTERKQSLSRIEGIKKRRGQSEAQSDRAARERERKIAEGTYSPPGTAFRSPGTPAYGQGQAMQNFFNQQAEENRAYSNMANDWFRAADEMKGLLAAAGITNVPSTGYSQSLQASQDYYRAGQAAIEAHFKKLQEEAAKPKPWPSYEEAMRQYELDPLQQLYTGSKYGQTPLSKDEYDYLRLQQMYGSAEPLYGSRAPSVEPSDRNSQEYFQWLGGKLKQQNEQRKKEEQARLRGESIRRAQRASAGLYRSPSAFPSQPTPNQRNMQSAAARGFYQTPFAYQNI
jgi:hypothetical protein